MPGYRFMASKPCRAIASWLVSHEEDRIPVVLQTGMRAGQVLLSQIDQFVFVFAGDRLATRTVQMRLHYVAFPVDAFLAAFICFL